MGETVTYRQGESIVLEGVNGSTFETVRQGYELQTKDPQAGETVFTALGKYAIYSPETVWQFIPVEQWIAQTNTYPEYPHRWADAEVLRTEARKGTFLPNHMDLLDASLFREQRVTSAMTKLAIASKEELHLVLQDYYISTADWSDSKIHDLYNYTKSNDPLRGGAEVENITLHSVNGALWLATAQTMLNVYHQDETGQTYKLQETWKTIFNSQGEALKPVRSKMQSSMGETGHLIGDTPERAWVTARRGLWEELGIEDDNVIVKMISTGSLLRRKTRGHHQFYPIAAEDRTHYFDVKLNTKKVRPTYINDEYDPDGKLRARILLKWFQHDKLPETLAS
jgi:hypothetical protein